MKLLTLRLQNFMGAKAFAFEPNGSDATIRGTNATGKTSLFSAFTWLLFGKDARGQAQFDIKTLGSDGEPLHNLEHSVEGEFRIGDDTLTLRKVLVEVWTRKRGSASSEFTGHRVDHFIDGVPVQKKEYDARIAEIAPEGVFRLLSDPDAFHSLHWEERRRTLLDVCGDVTDAEVIASDPDLADLPGILGKRSHAEHKKVVEARRSEINRELQAIPVRIDEATNGLPDLPSESREALDAKLATARDARAGLERRRARLEAGGEAAELQAQAREIDGQLADVARRVTAGADEALAKARRALSDRDEAVRVQKLTRAAIERELRESEADTQRLEARMATLRAQWVEIDERPAPHTDTPESCPACGQSLPEERIQAAHAKAVEEHNARKARELEEVTTQGQRAKQQHEAAEGTAQELRESLAGADAEIEQLTAAAAKAKALVDELAAAVPDPAGDEEHQALTARKADLEAKAAAVRESNAGAIADLREEAAAIESEARAIEQQLGAFDLRAKGEARIAELSDKEKHLSSEFERLARDLHLLDLSTRSKAALLTDRINARFTMTTFRLHEEQINGGLKDTCVALVNGVPYGTGLNRAARINSGLDVIRALQEHHAFFPPAWIDECESVVETLPLDAQVIRLVVDAAHPKLDIELHEAPQEVAA